MKHLTVTQTKILKHLASGECISGNELGNHLQISRTAVWKQIANLIEIGIKINKISKRGYQLEQPMILLNENSIRLALIQNQWHKSINFHLFSELNSTNSYLKELPATTDLSICCAEKQTQGRGRFGRNWISPFGENIYFSMRWRWKSCMTKLSGLSLVISLAVLACLNKQGIKQPIKIKWPNDLIWNFKKLAGVLIEINAESNGLIQLVIGVGININTATQHQSLPDKPWCSLYEITGKYHDRNQLIADLIYFLDQYIEQFTLHGFSSFFTQWQEVDYLCDQSITVSQLSGTISGKACGVNDSGELLLLDELGTMHNLSAGDTSLSMNAFK